MRTGGPPETLFEQVKAQVHALDSELPLYRVRLMTALISDALARPRATNRGGPVRNGRGASCDQRRVRRGGLHRGTPPPRGRRPAGFGGDEAADRTSVARDGAILAAAGVLAGTAASLAGARFLEWALFGISARDPFTFISVSAAILLVTIAASTLPAWRASRLDPMTVLKPD